LSLGNKIIPLSKEEADRWKRAIAPIIKQYVKETTDHGLPGQKAVKEIEDLIKKYSKIYK
jgi:hypothetical protein